MSIFVLQSRMILKHRTRLLSVTVLTNRG